MQGVDDQATNDVHAEAPMNSASTRSDDVVQGREPDIRAAGATAVQPPSVTLGGTSGTARLALQLDEDRRVSAPSTEADAQGGAVRSTEQLPAGNASPQEFPETEADAGKSSDALHGD